MAEKHYLAIWEYKVKAERVSDFERVYGNDGLWTQLFRRSSEYLGTELVRNLDRSGKYLTIDRWTSREALLAFKQDHAADYGTLDKQCERLTEAEGLIGEFEPSTPSSVNPSLSAPSQQP
jgi:heme-degrading monooxygenase HmoA